MYSQRVIEYVAFLYLRSLSFNQTIAILGAYYEQDVFTKDRLITHLERLTDQLPEQADISAWLKPKRSGYYAIDGLWFKYRGRDLVLLILFDVVTLDLVNYLIAQDEDIANYRRLLNIAKKEMLSDNQKIKGFFADGDLSLLKVLKEDFPTVPLQLCVFHKLKRISQIIPLKAAKTAIDKEIKSLVGQVLFAKSKQEAIANLGQLERYALKHQAYRKLRTVIGALKRNFDLLLTHFDHEEMSPYNNVLEGFNHVIKRRLRLMKGFKKPINIHRWLKLILLDWRFHHLKESCFQGRNNQSPLQLAGVRLPKIYNWIKYVLANYPHH